MNRTPASASSTVTVKVRPSPSLSTRPSPCGPPRPCPARGASGSPSRPIGGGDAGYEIRADHVGEQDPAARQAHVAAAYFEGVPVDPDGHVHEGEGAEQHEESGRHAADHRHQERDDAGCPVGAHGELNTQGRAGRTGGGEHPLGLVGGPAGPDGGRRLGSGMRRFSGVVPHASSVLRIRAAATVPTALTGPPQAQRAGLTGPSNRPSA